MMRILCAMAIALVLGAATTMGASDPPSLASVRTLATRLEGSGRATAQFERRGSGLTGSAPGRLTLEPPDRLRLDFNTGERLALRADGGEWVQPTVQQMVRLRADQVAAAAGYWDVLLGAAAGSFGERPAGKRNYVLIPSEGADETVDSLRIALDPQGLPARLVAWTNGDSLEFRLSRWSFAAPRGANAFKLSAPAGYEVVDLP